MVETQGSSCAQHFLGTKGPLHLLYRCSNHWRNWPDSSYHLRHPETPSPARWIPGCFHVCYETYTWTCIRILILSSSAGYVISAIFICAEYQRLGIHYREHRVLRMSFWFKLAFIFVEVGLAIGTFRVLPYLLRPLADMCRFL